MSLSGLNVLVHASVKVVWLPSSLPTRISPVLGMQNYTQTQDKHLPAQAETYAITTGPGGILIKLLV